MGECYQSLTAHQHQNGHTVPNEVIMIATSIQVTTVEALHCVRAFAMRPSLNKMSDKTWYPGWATGRLLSSGNGDIENDSALTGNENIAGRAIMRSMAKERGIDIEAETRQLTASQKNQGQNKIRQKQAAETKSDSPPPVPKCTPCPCEWNTTSCAMRPTGPNQSLPQLCT